MKCNRTLHDELRHSSASAPEHAGACSSASAVPFRPRLNEYVDLLGRHHACYLICRDFRFLFSVWWWRARSGFSKGETDGILVPIRWTRFCQTIFWGKGFGKTETDFFWGNSGLVSRAEEGSGEESARAFGFRFRREEVL